VSFPPRRGKDFHKGNVISREEFSGGNCSGDSQQACSWQMVNGRGLGESEPNIAGDKGILGNVVESRAVQSPRLEKAADRDMGGEVLDRREFFVEDKEQEMDFLPGKSSPCLLMMI
jgi:hypothetical protein